MEGLSLIHVVAEGLIKSGRNTKAVIAGETISCIEKIKIASLSLAIAMNL